MNPRVISYDGMFAIQFTRPSGNVLTWIQDITGRKMKSCNVNKPVVLFDSKQEAEAELLNIVIPYLLREKGVELEEIRA